MKKQVPPSNTPVQRSFADLPEDAIPLPILVSEKWQFPLQYHATDGKTYYAVQDWIVGLVDCDTVSAGKMWRQFKASKQNQSVVSNVTLNYHATDGKTYKRDFANDETLYLLSQYLRTTEDRPMLAEIKEYLAKAGALLDDWRINPEKMLSAAQARMRADIERHEKAGLGNRPEIILLKGKLELSETLKELKSSVTRLLELSDKEWGEFHNQELLYLLGYTAKQIRDARDSKKSARENMNIFEINGMKYCENQLIALLSMQNTMDIQRLKASVKFIFTPVGESLRGMMESIGIDVLSGKPLLTSGKDKQ